MMAQQGQLEQTRKGPRFLLYQGNRQEMKDGRLSFLKFDNYAIDLSFYTSKVAKRDRKPQELFIGELFAEAKAQPDRAAELLAEAHQRIIWPLYNFALSIFAASALLNGQFNRRGNWQRITWITLAAIVIIGVGMSLQNVVAGNPSLTMLIYLNMGAVLAGSFWFLREGAYPHIPISGGERI
jgi:lipopolysaccharide export system permease protein